MFGTETPTTGVPASGSAWIDPRLASVLKVTPGDPLQLGETTLSVASIITYEPDRAGDVFNIAPRLMFNLADVTTTGLVQPGSRVKHRLLVAGPPEAIDAYRDWLAAAPAPGERAASARRCRK